MNNQSDELLSVADDLILIISNHLNVYPTKELWAEMSDDIIDSNIIQNFAESHKSSIDTELLLTLLFDCIKVNGIHTKPLEGMSLTKESHDECVKLLNTYKG